MDPIQLVQKVEHAKFPLVLKPFLPERNRMIVNTLYGTHLSFPK